MVVTDKDKRPIWVKYHRSQFKVIFTSDNPRSEDPKSIINDMSKEYQILIA